MSQEKKYRDILPPDPGEAVFDFIASKSGEEIYKAGLEQKWSAYCEENRNDFDKVACYERSQSAISVCKPRTRLSIVRWAAAACIILLAVVEIWMIADRNEADNDYNGLARVEAAPTLILPDGSEVVIDQMTDNVRLVEGGEVLFTRRDDRLTQEKWEDDAAQDRQWITVSIPNGKLFDIVLEDGTQVWLNAGSKLHFPVRFGDEERRVYLEGEGYFEVARDENVPFILDVPGQSLTVLGTQFNVEAYVGDFDVITTLVNGKVRVVAEGGEERTLAPGQQTQLDRQWHNYTVIAVDTNEFTAWREGLINIEQQSLHKVLGKLSRWYSVEFRIKEDSIRDMVFEGALRSDDDLATNIRLLEAASQIKFSMKGDIIEVRAR